MKNLTEILELVGCQTFSQWYGMAERLAYNGRIEEDPEYPLVNDYIQLRYEEWVKRQNKHLGQDGLSRKNNQAISKDIRFHNHPDILDYDNGGK